MITLLAALFWVSFTVLVYHYTLYPLLLWMVARIRPCPIYKEDQTPSVSLIIAAYNEEQVIARKLENTIALAYPKDRLEIIVVADGSNDATVEIARYFGPHGVRVMHQPERRGKGAAMNRAAAEARGEILFFSDANTFYEQDVLTKMVRNFADSQVGGVSGHKIILADDSRGATAGETAYWSLETLLKEWQSAAGSIVTADGEIFALRRALYAPIPAGVVHDDMFQTLKLVEGGHRVVFEPEATSAENASKRIEDEFHLKSRYAAGGFQLVGMFRHLLFPPRSLFAWQFLSHKLLRWLAPVFLVVNFASAGLWAALAEGRWAMVVALFFSLQAVFYGVALAGWPLRRRLAGGPFYFPLYFCVANLAVLAGLLRWLRGSQGSAWRRVER